MDVREASIRKAIESIKNKNASGPEGIPAKLLKFGTAKLIKHTVRFF